MKRDDLQLILMILTTAALAAVVIALSDPFERNGSVKASFVSEQTYEECTKGKEKTVFDPSILRFMGEEVPYDLSGDTVFLPQSLSSDDFSGKFTVAAAGGRVCLLSGAGEEAPDKADCLSSGRRFKIAVVLKGSYMESTAVFTGLPAVCIDYEDGEIRGKEVHTGRIRVFDPVRRSCRSFDCSFHMRGSTSVMFDKKSYRVELNDRTGKKLKESLLGLRSDDDWVLNSLGTDKSLAREKVCYDLWKRLGEMEKDPVPAPAMEYTELFLGGSYMGVYGMMYPVDHKLLGMRPGDLLYKIKTWKEEVTAPGRLVDYNGLKEVVNTNGVPYAAIEYPEGEEELYDWGPLQAYQDFVFETGDLSTLTEKNIRLDTENFIFHELFCEMTRAGDNTWKNLYLAAYADGRGGYVLRETIWDLNYTFGDAFVYEPKKGNTVFLKDSTDNYKLRYDRDYGYSTLVVADDDTEPMTSAKWKKWREEGIGPELVESMFEENRSVLVKSGAMDRNEDRWPGSTLPDDSGIAEWIEGRFGFLDSLHGQP